VELRVLGPLEVRRAGVPVTVPGVKPRLLLARLLVDAGRVVTVDAIADALWGDRTPAQVAGTVQVYVSNLRRALGADLIVTRAPGYAVSLAGHDLDAACLASLVANARAHRAGGRAAQAEADARRAVALVRGTPFADVADEPWAQSEIVRLEELALAAHEELHGALLELGRSAEALPGLDALVAAHPLHEKLRGQLMSALYREGRQADALRCYAEGRRLLVEELGVDPSWELQQLESRILAHDVTLVPPAAAARVEPVGPGDAPVGRDAQRAALRAAWRDVEAGRTRVVLLDGEAGIGKSALARWIVREALDRGALAGVGRAHDLEGPPAFWPWTEALREVAALVPDEVGSGLADAPERSLLAPLLPELADRAGATPAVPFELFDTARRVLGRLAAHAPVVVVLDDLHWADQATLDLLRFLARSPGSARLLVVAAHRPVASDHPLTALRAALAGEPSVLRVTLPPLGDAEVRSLLERLVDGAVDERLVAAVAARTGGNPFFVEELVKLVRTPAGGLDLARAAVPETVREVILRRASVLGARAVDVLTLVSFAADEFTRFVPQRLLHLEASEVSAVFEQAVREGLIVEVPGRPGYHRFAHDMARHAFYDAVPQERRARTHLAVGRAIVEVLGAGASAAASELATHFSHAIDVGGAADAVGWGREAAAQAARSLAYADAVRHLRRALFVVRARLADERLECEVLIELAAAARLASDPATAGVARAAAHRLAARLGDTALVHRAGDVLLGTGPGWRPRRR